MRRTFAFALFFATVLLGQKVETQGKAWLNSNTEPAQLNVNGAWHAGEWGLVTLNQADGSRDVTGKVETDNFVVFGTVSAKKVFLLFTEKGSVKYSVEVSPEGPDSLAGRYADGLSWKSGTRLMHLTRADAQDRSSLEPKAAQAHVVVYRLSKYSGKIIKPSIYYEDQEAGLMYNGHYFTLALSPGRHSFASSSQYKAVTLDAEPGRTYYIRVALTAEDFAHATFGVEQVDSETALKELRD